MEYENLHAIKTHTDTIAEEAELFAMRVFYNGGSFTERDVNDFFVKLRMILSSIKSVNGSENQV